MTEALKEKLESLSPAEREELLARLSLRKQPHQSPQNDEVSYQQEQFWLLHQFSTNPEELNIVYSIDVHGKINLEILLKSLKTLVTQTDVFRFRFRYSRCENELILTEDMASEAHLECHQVASDEQWQSWLSHNIAWERRRPFDLEKECPLRCFVFERDKENSNLCFIVHHIALDGTSFASLWIWLADIYQAHLTNSPVPPRPTEHNYLAYARRQRQRLTEEKLAQNRCFWIRYLKGSSASLGLPEPKKQFNAPEDSHSLMSLPINEFQAVAMTSRHLRTTENIFFLATYFALLAETLGNRDICVGTPTTIRPDPRDEQVIGCCISMLCLRSKICHGMPFSTLLETVRDDLSAALAHADYPMQQLSAALERSNSSERNLFQTMFQYRNYWPDLGTLGDAECQLQPRRGTNTTFPLILEVIKDSNSGGIILSIHTDPNRFDESDRNGMLGRYRELLTLFTNDLSTPVLPAAEQSEIQGESCAYPLDETVVHFFSEQVRLNPEATAIDGNGASLTYAELDQRSLAIAHAIVESGIKQGEVVALSSGRVPDSVATIWGILRSGAAYLPLDVEAPEEWNRSIVKDAGAKLILHDRRGNFGSSIPGRLIEEIPVSDDLDPMDHSEPSSLAYIIYTSGSTGRPKGVMIGHRALTNFTFAAKEYMDLTVADRVLQFASLSFDASIEEIFPTHVSGGTLVLRSNEMIASPSRFGEFVAAQHITVVSIASGFWSELVHATDPGKAFPESLRLVVIGGERVGEQVVNRWLQLLQPRPKLLNTYGPTECTVVATVFPIPGDSNPATVDHVPIGRLIPNLTARVLDEENQPVSRGEPGELYLGGVGLADGYRNQETLSAEVFALDPLSEDPSSRLYRTGDRVRLLEDGNFEFLGRLDNQVKIRGFRVEPTEVELAIKDSAGVTGCCVTVTKDASEREALAAYVTLADGASLESIKAELMATLPAHLHPTFWTVLGSFPRTLSRKIDRLALPAPKLSGSSCWEAPASPDEIALAKIWQDLLKVDKVGRMDNFFALGGHSLLVMQLFARIESDFRNRPEIVNFLKNPVLYRLAEDLEESTAPSQSEIRPTPDTRPADEQVGPNGKVIEKVYPASLQQRFFHSLESFSSENAPVIVRLAFRNRGRFDFEFFCQAVRQIVERHEIYQTVYRESDYGLEAVVFNQLPPIIDYKEAGGIPEEEILKEICHWSTNSWDLSTESPIRLAIRRICDEEHLLCFSFHHISLDGGSWGLFSNELDKILNRLDLKSDLPPVKNETQFSAYSARQEKRLLSNSNVDFWVKKLEGLPAPMLHSPEPASFSQGTMTSYCSVAYDLWSEIVNLAREWHSTPHNLLMAAFHSWHYRYLGFDDVAIGTPINARLLSGDEGVHGCTVYMLPIRQQMHRGISFREVHKGVQITMLESIQHAEVNLMDVADKLAVRDGREAKLYTAIFQVQDLQSNLPTLFPGASVERLRLPQSTLHAPLLLQVSIDHGDCVLSLSYDPKQISKVESERILKSFHVLLRNLLNTPEASLVSQALVDTADRKLLLNAWAGRTGSYPRDRSLPFLFQEIAQKYPDRAALVDDYRELSYAQLAQEAEKIAMALQQRGIGPGQHVGVCMERSADLIITLIAILKIGSAYVPIDPEYPINHIQFLVDDSEATVVVSHKCCYARLPSIDVRIWLIEDILQGHSASGEQDFPMVAPLDPAYLMYTSGTTGQPKGSLIPHRGIVRLVKGADYARFGPDETYLLLASPSFDAATFEIWAPLLNGGKLVIMPPGTPSLSEIGEVIKNSGVTTLWLTARLFDTIIDEAPDILRPIRQLLIGGETLSPNHVARCKKALPDLTLINGYGPTENTTFSCCYRVPEDPPSDKPIPIGRPIANSEAYILDLHLQPVPPGAIGELFLGGDGLSLGYWKQAELNDEVFVRNPFTADPKALLYRTGDLARYLPDGNIEFIGRHDQQVKIRGFRVELAEVETLLEKSPAIDRCCALLMEDDGNKAIAVAVVPSNALSSESALTKAKQYSAKNLPHYLQPERWLAVDSLPLTQNGKLDRDDLQKRFAEVEVSASPMVDPQPGIETQLLEIWQRLFQSNRISTDDNFFSIGGDSLKAMRLASEIERQLKRHLPLAEIFRNPTIQTLGSFLGGTRDGIKSTVITLRNGGQKKQGLFILHGWGGEVFAQTSFMDNIPEGFPVYGVQAVEHSGEDERLTSFEEMAKRYARDIVEQQPEGPYYLCGYSLGGMIAYETARQLYLGGYEIGHLIVLDTHPKNLPWYLQVRVQMGQLVIRLFHHLVQIITAKGGFSWRYIKGRINALRLRIGLLKLPYAVPDDVAEIELAVKTDYYAILNDRFIPIPFPIKTTVFRAKGAMTGLGVFWRYLSKNNVVLEDVPSSHNEMLRPPELARRVGELVKE